MTTGGAMLCCKLVRDELPGVPPLSFRVEGEISS